MSVLKNFAVLEGGDGSGTSTQLALLGKRMAKDCPQTVFFPTFEPTEGPVGVLIRSILRKQISVQPETTARLFSADRQEHLYAKDGVVERCGRGELVVSDRYALSSLVYQGIECGDELPHSLNAAFPLPELLLFFDVDPEIAQQRMQASRTTLEIYENVAFQKQVRQKYHTLLEQYRQNGVKVEVIDAALSPEEVAEQVWSAVSKMPIFK